MSGTRSQFRLVRLVTLAALSGGCNQLLGIETLAVTSDAGSGDSGADAEDRDAGRATQEAGARDAGHAADEMRDAAVRPDASLQPSDAGPAAPRSGAAAPDPATMRQDAGADANPASPAPRRIRGKVIDFWRRPVAALSVSVGPASTQTDERGEFSIDASGNPYDALITYVVTFASGNPRTYRQLFRGLTRADPTLQVEIAPGARTARVEAAFSGREFPLPSQQRVNLAFGSAGLSWNIVPTQADARLDSIWYGPASLAGVAHALTWTLDASGELPTGYLGHDAQPLTMNDGAPSQLGVALTQSALETDSVSASVSVSGTRLPRTNVAYLQWSDGARIPIARDTGAPDEFSFAVPKLAGASLRLAAISGVYQPGPFAVAHQSNVAPGQAAIALAIPAPATLLAPADNADDVGHDTRFEWSGRPIVHTLYLLNGTTEALRVITAGSSAQLPRTAAGEFSYDRSRQYAFWVETHGDYATVDDASGPDGFLDEYAAGVTFGVAGEPDGPVRAAGSYTASTSRRIMLAP